MALILIEGGREVVRPPSAPGLHPIFADCCNPAIPPAIDEKSGLFDLRSPWREGPMVYATDGAIVCFVAETHLPRATFDAIRKADRSVPSDMGSRMQGAGPFEDRPIRLPSVIAVPDAHRRACSGCRGTGHLQAPGAPTCPACGGTKVHPRAGRGVKLIDTPIGFPALGLDAWYLTMLRRHKAEVYPPRLDRANPARIAAFRFKVGPHVMGFVQPFVLPR